jgi:uncharacterized protein
MPPASSDQTKLVATCFWRRLDQPGHDCCRLFRLPGGWKLRGMAVFSESGHPCNFAYEVMVDPQWQTRSARLTGFRGTREIDMRIRRRRDGSWRVGTEVQHEVVDCVDIDLGFTPATNLLAVRRLRLNVGEQADAPAAWLALPSLKLSVLPQKYLRSAKLEYDYEAPSVGYKGRLHVSTLGVVEHYPGLFESVPTSWRRSDSRSGRPRDRDLAL